MGPSTAEQGLPRVPPSPTSRRRAFAGIYSAKRRRDCRGCCHGPIGGASRHQCGAGTTPARASTGRGSGWVAASRSLGHSRHSGAGPAVRWGEPRMADAAGLSPAPLSLQCSPCPAICRNHGRRLNPYHDGGTAQRGGTARRHPSLDRQLRSEPGDNTNRFRRRNARAHHRN